MFIVLYGLTGTIGDQVRMHFEKNSFRRLQKVYYTPSEIESNRLKEGKNTVVSDCNEINKKCDYKYQINNRTVGFNKKDFDNAVQGKEDLYTTLSCLDIEFLKSLKAEYGEYVTIVYVYTDDKTLKCVVQKYGDSERKEKLKTSKLLKNVYINNISLFDKTAIYGGENSVFDLETLLLQLDVIVDRAKNNEVMLNSQRKVELPYVGTDDYIFVSYSHKDKKKVEEKLHMLQRNGFRVWYDTGIKGGQDWKKLLREKIKFCKNFIVFTSKNSVNSEDVKIEIVTAEIYEKKIINVRLDGAEFVGTIENILHNLHAINDDSIDFEDELIKSLDNTTREKNEFK